MYGVYGLTYPQRLYRDEPIRSVSAQLVALAVAAGGGHRGRARSAHLAAAAEQLRGRTPGLLGRRARGRGAAGPAVGAAGGADALRGPRPARPGPGPGPGRPRGPNLAGRGRGGADDRPHGDGRPQAQHGAARPPRRGRLPGAVGAEPAGPRAGARRLPGAAAPAAAAAAARAARGRPPRGPRAAAPRGADAAPGSVPVQAAAALLQARPAEPREPPRPRRRGHCLVFRPPPLGPGPVRGRPAPLGP